MKINALLVTLFIAGTAARGQTIIEDNYNVAGNGTGFSLNTGINSGINPPTTRLTGLISTNLRYIPTEAKPSTAFSITGNKLQVTSASNPGRFVLSANGTTSFDFAPALGVGSATPQNPAVYDLSISMVNNTPGTQRFSFALSTAEGDATTWDFGIQVYHTAASDTFYTIGKRVDIAASGLSSDLNSFITNTAVGSDGSEITFLMRVTDAGAASFNSRVQLSMDGGVTWIYDTSSDPDLPNGWRLSGPERHIMWDVAPSAGPVTYDNFSVRLVSLSAAPVAPANNAQNIGASPTLTATVSNANSGNVTVTFFGRELPKPGPGPDFLIPVLPDTQNYAREASGSGDATKEMWFAQTEWIITNRVAQNIPFVATLGDCVNTAGTLSQWRNATNAYYRLENSGRTLLGEGIPYGVTVGNHDQAPNGDENGDTTYYNQFFGTSHFDDRPYYGGHYSTNNDSWYDLFSAGGMDFLVISFEFGRYGSVIMDWARDVMAAHPTRRVIVLTHYAGQDVADVNATTCPFGAQGQAIYTGLRTNANFFLMMSGHVFNDGGEGRRADTFQGHTIRTLVSDYQGRFNGGNGLMRLMYFSPSNNLVSVKTYSPYTDKYETDANSQFSFSYNMQPNGAGSPGTPIAALGTNVNVSPGSQSSFVWTGLQANRTYEWYVQVTDEQGNTVFSSPRQFTTTVNSAPVASNQTVTVIGDQPTQLRLGAFDSNGDALSFQISSRPIRGLNTDFDPTNGTITYLPAHGYRGLDRFTFYVTDGFAISSEGTVDVNVIAPPDTNSNGLPDSWENAYGISDPNGDNDGDGWNNFAEYTANTNPTNATSFLKILGASFQTNQANGAFELSWSSIGGTRYRVQYSDNLTNGFTDVIRFIDTEMDPAPYGTPSTQSFLDTFTQTGIPTNSARFYRVQVVP
jgi:hypothetical protein